MEICLYRDTMLAGLAAAVISMKTIPICYPKQRCVIVIAHRHVFVTRFNAQLNANTSTRLLLQKHKHLPRKIQQQEKGITSAKNLKASQMSWEQV